MEKFTYVSKAKLNNLPKTPGVYALSSSKNILYIGKAGNIKDRVKNHFQKSSWRDTLFVDKITEVGYIETQSDVDALLLESSIIKKRQPKYNVMWRNDKKYFYVAITLPAQTGKDKLPRVFITHQPNQKPSITYIGPFVEGKSLKYTLRLLRRAFPYYTTKKHSLIRCTYCHLDLCPGPEPNEKLYKKNLKDLASVLKGKKKTVLKNLKKEMAVASKIHDFEKAAILRDQVQALERIMSNALSFSPIIKETPIEWEKIEAELQSIFQTKKPISRIEAYDISNIQGKEATGSQVTFDKGKPSKDSYRKYKIRLVHNKNRCIAKRSAGTPRYNARQSQAVGSDPNDFAMMEELVSRRLNHKEWKYPDLMIIDGGKGQLSSAQKALKKSKILLGALAKRNNELFIPGRKNPVLLKDVSSSVRNLILYIRDEAHRFAIKYHRKLRKKELIPTS